MANRRLSEEVVVEDLKPEFQRRNSSCSWMSRVSRRRLTVGPKKRMASESYHAAKKRHKSNTS